MERLEKDEEGDGLILQIDYEKCFDRVEPRSLLGALRYFDFPDYVLNWTKFFYTNIKSCVVNNGHISPFFPVTRSVCQGAPCSPYYFLIIAELLAISFSYEKTKK